MLIHLEAANCTSGTNRTRIDFLAFKCYQRRKYTTDQSGLPFCPHCRREFRFLPGLSQHVEMTPNCKMHTQMPNCLAKLEYFVALHVWNDKLYPYSYPMCMV